jgi:hypothetical protein
MALEILEPEEQPLVDGLAQAVHGPQVTVAGLGFTRVDPLDLVATDRLAHFLRGAAPHPGRVEFAFGITAPALERELTRQPVREKEGLLRPATGGQVVDDCRQHGMFARIVHGAS